MPSICTRDTNAHVQVPHFLGWLALQHPAASRPTKKHFAATRGSSHLSSQGEQHRESPLFPCGKSQLVRAALPPGKADFKKIQDTGVPKFAGAAAEGCSSTCPGSPGGWSPHRPGWAHAPTRSPAQGRGAFLGEGEAVKFAAAAAAGARGILRADEPGAGAPLRGGSRLRRPSPRAGEGHRAATGNRGVWGGRRGRGPPRSGTHLLLDGSQQPLPGLRLCGEKGERLVSPVPVPVSAPPPSAPGPTARSTRRGRRHGRPPPLRSAGSRLTARPLRGAGPRRAGPTGPAPPTRARRGGAAAAANPRSRRRGTGNPGNQRPSAGGTRRTPTGAGTLGGASAGPWHSAGGTGHDDPN